MKRIFTLLAAAALLCGVLLPVYAAGQVTYDGNSKDFIFLPGSEYSPTDLFANFKDVMPGDSLTETLRVYNAPSNNVKVNIYMRSLGSQPGSEDFLSKLNLTVSKSEENKMAYMFDASAAETDGLSDWVLLGTLYSGGDVKLDITLNVPIELGNEYQNAIGYIDWQFKVDAFPIEPDDPEPPQTGDDGAVVLWISCGSVAFALAVIIAASRRRRGEAEE